MTVSPPRRAPWLTATLGLVAALLLLLLAAGPARAGDEAWSCSISPGRTCPLNERHYLVMSAAYHDSTTRSLGAAASLDGTLNGLYGSIAWDTSWACHSYGGKTVLFPLIANGSLVPMTVKGLMSYGSDGEPC
jgi:hypothetical protein